MLSNIYKNIFNNFLIAKSRRTRTLLFQKLPSPASASAPKSRNAPVLYNRKLSISNEQFITLLRSRDEPVEKGIILEVCTLFLQRFIRRAQESDGLLIESFR